MERQRISLRCCSEQVADQIRTQISVVSEQVTNVEENLANLTSDEKNLEAKIEKKRHTLERKQQRLKSMATVRPAHQDEYEACEAQLREQYASYLEKFRNQEYLEHQLDRHLAAQKQEADEHDRNLRRMQVRAASQRLLLNRPKAVCSCEDGVVFVSL